MRVRTAAVAMVAALSLALGGCAAIGAPSAPRSSAATDDFLPGSQVRRLTDTTRDQLQRIGEPTWTPDGKRIVASRGVLDGPDNKRIVDPLIVFVDPSSGGHCHGRPGCAGAVEAPRA